MKSLASFISILYFAQTVFAKNHFFGVTAANSIGGTGSYTCRTQKQWNQVANDARGLGMSSIRIMGFDCNALEMASSACAQAGIKLMAGIYIQGTVAAASGDIDNQVQDFRNAVGKYGANRYVGLTVGNEVQDSADSIMKKVNDVRSHLNSAGIHVPVSTVHTWVFIRDNPKMCSADFVGANAHAFYDPPSTSSTARSFISNTVVPALKKVCSGKPIYITESGWPSAGGKVGAGVASPSDELTALKGLNCAAQGVSLYAFEYDDQLWKSNANEKSFGMWDKIHGFVDSC